MKTITVKKTELLKALNENKKKHEEEYALAYDGYLTHCVERLKEGIELRKELIETIKSGKEFEMHFEASYPSEPDDNSEEYQNVIDMVETAEENEFELTQEEYLRYYKNKWEWRDRWVSSYDGYMTTGSANVALGTSVLYKK